MMDDCHDHCLYRRYCRKWTVQDNGPNDCDEYRYWDKIADDNYDYDDREDECDDREDE